MIIRQEFELFFGHTDGRMDGRTDGRTHKASYRVACPQLKTKYCNLWIGSPRFVGYYLLSHITPLFPANWHIILIQEESLANCKARHRWWHFLKRLAKVVESRPNFRPRIREAKKKGANEVIYSPDSEEEGRNPFLAVLRQVTWDFQLGVREKKVLFPIEYDLRNSRKN